MELMNGFKLSDAGLIPEDWGAAALGKVCARPNRYGLNAAAAERGVPYLRITDIDEDGRLIHPHEALVDDVRAVDYLATNGDLFFARTGASTGKCYRYREADGPLSFAGFLVRVTPNPDELLPALLDSQVRESRYWQWIAEVSMRSGQPGVNGKQLGEFTVALPPLAEQREITRVLEDVGAWIAAAEAEAEKLGNVKAAALNALLTPTSRLPGFTGEWAPTTIGEAAYVMQGGTPSTVVPMFWGGDIPWCTPTDITAIQGNSLFKTERTISEAGLQACAAKLLPIGSILLCTRATVGEAKIAAVPVATNQGFRSLIARPHIDPIFLFYMVLSLKLSFIERASGSTFLEISKTEVEATLMLLPPTLAEQHSIVTVLTDIDTALTAALVVVAKAKAVRAAAMDALLSGRTRLPLS